jgi:pyranose oxidase
MILANKKVLIIGAGPVGSAFARKILYQQDGNGNETLRDGIEVHMIDAGAMLSQRPGEHLKNSYLYQRNVNLFTGIIRGHLHILSTPVDRRPVITLDPGAARFDKPFVHNSQNPDQDPDYNLDAAAASYGVGGMATHWTCACPYLHEENERPVLETSSQADTATWKKLYTEAERLLAVKQSQKPDGSDDPDYPFANSLRHKKVVSVLKRTFPKAGVKGLPLACRKAEGSPERIDWNGADTVLGDLIQDPAVNSGDGELQGGYVYCDGRLTIYPSHQCKKLNLTKLQTPTDGNEWTIESVEIKNLTSQEKFTFKADTYIVAAGAVLTPQILFNSGISPLPDEDWKPAEGIKPEEGVKHKLSLPVGLFLTEQPIAFSQIVLKQSIIDEMKEEYRRSRPGTYGEYVPPKLAEDPLQDIIPSGDLEPQAYIPFAPERPWHCQIHRDAFNYGELAPNVDGRLIVDLRWFGQTWQDPRNRVTFRSNINDVFGMPQPTFTYSIRDMPMKDVVNPLPETLVEDFAALNKELGQKDPSTPPNPQKPESYYDVLGAFKSINEFEDLKKNQDSLKKLGNVDKEYLDLRRVRAMQHGMMGDMLQAAEALGGFLPGSEPQFMAPGLTLHIHGTTRIGNDPHRSVVNSKSKVHKVANLYLGGNGLLSLGESANPTLTSVAFAIRASEQIVNTLTGKVLETVTSAD